MITGGVADCVGQTPLIKIESLSRETGCEIFGKAEFLNPGGSVKDRTALGILQEARKSGKLKPGARIVEGTAGNTGIGLATVAAQWGHPCTIVMPNNQSEEKIQTLRALGAELVLVEPVPFANQNHFYHTARRLSEENPGWFWADQFENLANFQMHFTTTGPEIWQQTSGKVDVFVAAVGTGGTMAGVSQYLKQQKPTVQTVLADPLGSGLFCYLKEGKVETVGTSITEGIGIMRLTKNFLHAKVDHAVRVTDEQMLAMLYHLASKEGLLVGTSAALNVYAAYSWAKAHQGKGLKIVTVLCDSALRYQSRVFNSQFLAAKGLTVKSIDQVF